MLESELFDAYYAELGRCRDHCNAKPTVTYNRSIEHIGLQTW